MGLFEKRRFKNMLVWIQKFDAKNTSTWNNLNPNTATMQEVCFMNVTL